MNSKSNNVYDLILNTKDQTLDTRYESLNTGFLSEA